MRKFIDGYYRLLNALLALSVAILVLPVTIQMISRLTGLIPAWIWTEELARFLFIWMVMLGAMIGVRDGSHFDVDVWPELSPRPNALLRIVSLVFVLVFALINLEIADWFSTGQKLELVYERDQARDLVTSAAWGAYGLLLLALGIWRRSRGLRYASLFFILLTVGKVFWQSLAPYAVARFFGGPAIWKRHDESVTGSDRYHVQLGAGVLATAAGRMGAFVEVIPLGERSFSLGATVSF